MKKRMLALTLAVLMLFSLLPANVFASEQTISEELTDEVCLGGVYYLKKTAFCGTPGYSFFSLGKLPGTVGLSEWTVMPGDGIDLSEWTEPTVMAQMVFDAPILTDIPSEPGELVITVTNLFGLSDGGTVTLRLTLTDYNANKNYSVQVTLTAETPVYNVEYLGPRMYADGYAPEDTASCFELSAYAVWAELNGRIVKLCSDPWFLPEGGSVPQDSSLLWDEESCSSDALFASFGCIGEDLFTMISEYGVWTTAAGAPVSGMPAARGNYRFTVDPGSFSVNGAKYSAWTTEFRIFDPADLSVSMHLERTVEGKTDSLTFTGAALTEPFSYDERALFRLVPDVMLGSEPVAPGQYEPYPAEYTTAEGESYSDSMPLQLRPGQYTASVPGMTIGGYKYDLCGQSYTFTVVSTPISSLFTGGAMSPEGDYRLSVQAIAGREGYTIFSLGKLPSGAYAEIEALPESGVVTEAWAPTCVYGQNYDRMTQMSDFSRGEFSVGVFDIPDLEAGQSFTVTASVGVDDPGFEPCTVTATVTAVSGEYVLDYLGRTERGYDPTLDPAATPDLTLTTEDNLDLFAFGSHIALNGRTLLLYYPEKTIPTDCWSVSDWFLCDPIQNIMGNLSEETYTLATDYGSWKTASGVKLSAVPGAEGDYLFSIDPTGYKGQFGSYTFAPFETEYSILPVPTVKAYLEQTAVNDNGSRTTELIPFDGSELAVQLKYRPECFYRFFLSLSVNGETIESGYFADYGYEKAPLDSPEKFSPVDLRYREGVYFEAGRYRIHLNTVETEGIVYNFDQDYTFSVLPVSLAEFFTEGAMSDDIYYVELDAPAYLMGFEFNYELGQFPIGTELKPIDNPEALAPVTVDAECTPAEGWKSDGAPLFGNLVAEFSLMFPSGSLLPDHPDLVLAELQVPNDPNYLPVSVGFLLNPVDLTYSLNYDGELRRAVGTGMAVYPYEFTVTGLLNGREMTVTDTQSTQSDISNMLYAAPWLDASGETIQTEEPSAAGRYLRVLTEKNAEGLSLHYYPITLQFTVYDPTVPCDHVLDAGEILAERGVVMHRCTLCGETVCSDLTTDEAGDRAEKLPDSMAEIVSAVGEDPTEMTLSILAYSREISSDTPAIMETIVEDLADAPITNANGKPISADDVEIVYDISAFAGGQRYAYSPEKSVLFCLNVGTEMAHELEEGTVQLAHSLDNGRTEILQPSRIDTERGIVFLRVQHFSPFALIRVQETQYFGRLQLSKMPNGCALVHAYDLLAAGIEAGEESVTVFDAEYSVAVENRALIMDAYLNDYPQHFWLMKTYSYSYLGSLLYAYYPQYDNALKARQDEFVRAAESLIAEAGITAANVKTLSDYEKVLRLHDVIVQHNDYISTAPNRYNAYGCIVDGQSVCEGIAEAYQYLLQEVGVASHRITGSSINPSTGKSIGHAWNVVRENGKWYYIDLTWDDQGTDSYETFYAYFNLTESAIKADHIFDSYFYALPECTSTELNYFSLPENRSKKCSTSGALAEIVRQLKTEKRSFARLKLTDPENFKSWIIANAEKIAMQLGLNGYRYGYMCLGGEYHIRFMPYSYSEYQVNLPAVLGYHIVAEDGFLNPVVQGGSYRFTVAVSEGYETSDPFVVKANGKKLSASNGVYEISNIGSTQTIAVETVEPEPPKPITLSMVGGALNADGKTATVRLLADGTKPSGTASFTANFDSTIYKVKTKETMPGVNVSVSGGTVTVSWTENRSELATLTFEAVGTPMPTDLILSGSIPNATYLSGKVGLTCALQTPQVALSDGTLTVRLTDARFCTPKPTQAAKLLLVLRSDAGKALASMAPAEILNFDGSGAAEASIPVECGSADSIRVYAIDETGALRPLSAEAAVPVN